MTSDVTSIVITLSLSNNAMIQHSLNTTLIQPINQDIMIIRIHFQQKLQQLYTKLNSCKTQPSQHHIHNQCIWTFYCHTIQYIVYQVK